MQLGLPLGLDRARPHSAVSALDSYHRSAPTLAREGSVARAAGDLLGARNSVHPRPSLAEILRPHPSRPLPDLDFRWWMTPLPADDRATTSSRKDQPSARVQAWRPPFLSRV